MKQDVGETRDAIMEDDNRKILKIMEKNAHKRNPYYIVLFVKESRSRVDGKPTLIKFLKAYDEKPQSQVGMVVGTVDNTSGTVKWEVNLPDKPFGYELLGTKQDGAIVQETTVPQSYQYN